VSVDTTAKSSDVETINVEEDEGDMQSPKATTAPSPGRQAAETPDAWGARAFHIKHRPSGQRRVEQEVEEGPGQAFQAES
jgi:hypothetical protein